MTIPADKAALRRAVRAGRAARPETERAEAAARLAEQVLALVRDLPAEGPALVSAYLSLPTEPGTDPLLAALHAAGHAIWVPRIEGASLAWVGYRPGDPVGLGPMGIREPLGPAVDPDDLDGLDLMLLPGLAVDRRGRRLGQGGGFYDRVLADVLPHDDGGPLRAVLLFDDEVLDDVPHDEHDCVVDVAVTPAGIVRLA